MELVTGTRAGLVSTPTIHSGENGTYLYTNGTSTSVSVPDIEVDDYTFYWQGTPLETGGSDFCFAADDNPSANRQGIFWRPTANSGTLLLIFAGATYQLTSLQSLGGTYSIGQRMSVAVSRRGTTAVVYIKGVRAGTITIPADTAHYENLRIGGWRQSGIDQGFYEARHELVFFDGVAYTDQQVASIHRNPNQIFMPEPHIDFGVAPAVAAGFNPAWAQGSNQIIGMTP